MEQRRVLIAFLLMAVVLAASQWWYGRLSKPEPGNAPADSVATAPGRRDTLTGPARPARETTPPADSARVVVSDTAVATVAVAPADTAPNQLLPEGRAPAAVVVETPLYRARIDPVGGVLEQVFLTRYESYTRPTPVALVPSGLAFLERSADLGERRVDLAGLAFHASDSLLRLTEGDSARTLTLEYVGGGRRIVQTYRFRPATYVIDYRLDLGEKTDGVLHTTLGPRLDSNEKNPKDDYGALRGVARVDGEIVTEKPKNLEASVALGGKVDWAGLRNMYFLGAVLAPADGPRLTATTFEGGAGDSLPVVEVSAASPITDGVSAYRLYFGPQEFRRLHALNDGLDEVNQYGWSWINWMVTPFAKWIVLVMLWLHRFIPSYGMVLVVFAVLVRLALWPLTTKSYRSIQAMQEIQPEIQRIREQYKSDPQKMQQETMRLYREKKVNPLGGCLPNLLPMPILFALFFVFRSTIEFRGQAFLWLPDLSQPDPLYVLPVLMGLTMYATSKMTTTDPKMAPMTYVMPVVLTFVFINLASGLVLYYALSNVTTFAQQWWLRQGSAPAPAEAEEAPAKGRVKKPAGKT